MMWAIWDGGRLVAAVGAWGAMEMAAGKASSANGENGVDAPPAKGGIGAEAVSQR
jgi:hypothetical protein